MIDIVKIINYNKQSTTDALDAALKRAIQKEAEVTGDLISNRDGDKITKFSKISRQNNLETVTNKLNIQIYMHIQINSIINCPNYHSLHLIAVHLTSHLSHSCIIFIILSTNYRHLLLS